MFFSPYCHDELIIESLSQCKPTKPLNAKVNVKKKKEKKEGLKWSIFTLVVNSVRNKLEWDVI